MEKFENVTLIDYVDGIKSKKFTATDGVKHYQTKIKNDHRNAVIEVFPSALTRAREIDEKIKRGDKLGRLCGAPIIIKDNILYAGHISSCGSKMLEKFVAPYTSTVVQKLLDEDAIILGRSNMDEFAMGTTGETSTYGATLNAHSDKHVAGGSSSGSATAVACDLCVASLGTDTGGSIRCPSAWNGLYSLKPTYGTVSRYGIIAYASSLDQCGPICKTAPDTALLLDVIHGRDPLHDATSIASTPITYPKTTTKQLKIGYIEQIWKHADTIQGFDRYKKLFDDLKQKGHKIVPLSIENIDLALATYYIIAPAECASNLARFDGVRYTSAPENPKNLETLYKKTRTDYFGDEVKRRINLGNYVLSSGYFDAFYGKAKSVQSALRAEFAEAFKKCDVVIVPTTPGEAPLIKDKSLDKVSMYLIDLFTIVANIVGIPAMAVPFGTGKTGLPIGMQIMGAPHAENLLFETEKIIAEVLK